MKSGTKALARLVALICVAFAVACSSYAPEPKFGAGLSTNLPGGTVASLQGNVFIDPQNVSGCATDSNLTCSLSTCGTTGDGPCKTYGQLLQRWGTNSPFLRLATVINLISSHTDDTDPIVLKAFVGHGVAPPKFKCPLGAAQQVGTGTFSSFVAKSTAGSGQLTQAALGFTATAHQLVDNTTHAGRAWTRTNVSGTTWTFTQPWPVNNYTVLGSEVTTWAASDAIAVYEPIAINLVDFEPMILDSTGTTELAKVEDCTILDPGGIGNDSVRVNDFVAFSEVKSQRNVVNVSPVGEPLASFSTPTSPGLFNVVSIGAGNSSNQLPTMGGNAFWSVVAGEDATTNGIQCNYCVFDADHILFGGQLKYSSVYNGLYLPSGGGPYAEGTGFEAGPVWGAGTWTFTGTERSWYTATNSTATFKNTGGLKMTGSGATTACSTSGATTQTQTCGITLNVTNLDAAASGSGFGQNAFGQGGSPSVYKGFP